MRTSAIYPALFLLTVAVAACASSRHPETSGSRYLITAEQLEGLSELDAWEAVVRLRPYWFREADDSGRANDLDEHFVVTRGPNMHLRVYVDGELAAAPTLRELPASQVSEIRYLNRAEASARFGTTHGKGAIIVRTKGP